MQFHFLFLSWWLQVAGEAFMQMADFNIVIKMPRKKMHVRWLEICRFFVKNGVLMDFGNIKISIFRQIEFFSHCLELNVFWELFF